MFSRFEIMVTVLGTFLVSLILCATCIAQGTDQNGHLRSATVNIPTSGHTPLVVNVPVDIPTPQVITNNIPAPSDQAKPWYERVGGIIAACLGASIGATISIYAFVVYPNNLKRLELRLNFVESQIKELYGPLLGECLQADGIFRRVELAMLRLGPEDNHRHFNFRELRVDDFSATLDNAAASRSDRRRLFAKILKDIYLPSNQKRADLLQHNLHLIGPYPPLSLFLFLTHAAQLKSLVMIKQKVDLNIEDHSNLDRYGDPYILTPFPTAMTAEVVAKVALLKALQNEYRHRIGRSKLGVPGEIFFRDQYFLLLPEDLRDQLGAATDALHARRDAKKLAHYPPACPLVWGPYTAVELFELRSWLITKERPLRNFEGLEGEHLFIVAMLDADVAEICSETDPQRVARPLHHRVAQAFDELDVPGSKMNHAWSPNFEWEDLAKDPLMLSTFKRRGHKLHNLPKAPGFAYRVRAYAQMRETPLDPAEAAKSPLSRFRQWLTDRRRA